MKRYAILDSNNQVYGLITGPDNGSIVAIPDDQSPIKYDIWDGTQFNDNPALAALQALQAKKNSIEQQISACADDAAVNALLKTLDTQYNP